MKRPLPKFDNPPVIEVALSVQFDRLNFSTAHLGLVWQRFRDRFPIVSEKPEIDAVIERFPPQKKRVTGVQFQVGLPTPRLWFMNQAGNELVQVQRDRFVRNWRKTEGDHPRYSSYDKLRAGFVQDWELFTKFVSEECESPLTSNQCEVTYVNIIEDVDSAQLANVISWIRGTYSDDYLLEAEDTTLALTYVLTSESGEPWGRLHIAASPAFRAADDKRVVRLSLTARGAPETQDTEGVLESLDREHEAVVRGFASITTVEMHNIWERTA